MIFLCIWSTYFSLSDYCMGVLVTAFHAIFRVAGILHPTFSILADRFPSTVTKMYEYLGLNSNDFVKYVVCPKCEALYKYEECFVFRLGRNQALTCQHVEFPNHRQRWRRAPCKGQLLKEVTLKDGKVKLYPLKTYCYKSVRAQLIEFLKRPGFAMKCELWRNRDLESGLMGDVYDGRIWKEWQYAGGRPYLASPGNYAFMLNIDWFQPFEHRKIIF